MHTHLSTDTCLRQLSLGLCADSVSGGGFPASAPAVTGARGGGAGSALAVGGGAAAGVVSLGLAKGSTGRSVGFATAGWEATSAAVAVFGAIVGDGLRDAAA